MLRHKVNLCNHKKTNRLDEDKQHGVVLCPFILFASCRKSQYSLVLAAHTSVLGKHSRRDEKRCNAIGEMEHLKFFTVFSALFVFGVHELVCEGNVL